MFRPSVADNLANRFQGLYRLLLNKFYIDELYQKVFVDRTIGIGNGLWKRADAGLIDGVLVNGSAKPDGRTGFPGTCLAERITCSTTPSR